MTILYIMKYPLMDDYVLKNKFDGQMDALINMGHNVFYVAYDHEYTYLMHKNEKKRIKRTWFSSSKIYIHTKAFFDLYDSVIRIMKERHFDLVYFRLAPLSMAGIRMCRILKKNKSKIVVEIPTYPPEKKRNASFIRNLYIQYSDKCWAKINNLITLYTLIGDEANEYNGRPAINIDNGINIDKVKIRKPQFDNKKIHLLAVASMSEWQGYDRLINSIAQSDRKIQEQIVFHMIGPDGDGSLVKWKRIVESNRLEDIVLFHGMLTGKELDPYFDLADVGICTLGLYRKGLEQASILKLREYAARGLPFIYAAMDPALSSEEIFCIRVSNDDNLIDMEKIVAFAKEMRKNEELPEKIRSYAHKHMSWDYQMAKVINRVNEL